ncbi:MAG: hypothetical protein EBZ48_01790 [Proteobacteria bacterium]|nr:hypothetical protein [Pseudomonadota bacterium]
MVFAGFFFFSREFVSARVEGIIPQSGECRRPSGRYQHCTQSRAVVVFQTKGPEAGERRGEIFIPEKKITLQPGDSVLVAYRGSDPQDLIFPDVRSVATVPLGIFFTALILLGLERLTR